jgi:predicted phage terminase large subunit-like protein
MLNDLSGFEESQLRSLMANWRLTPATFAHKISRGRWIPKQWLLYVSAIIARECTRGNARIIISAPPRHGKSELTSINVPGWLLEVFPQHFTILATYGSDLAVGFGRRVRDMFTDAANADLLRTKLKEDSRKVNAFLTEEGGGMFSVGLGGPITGRGANTLIIDDYIKEIKEALSASYRDYVWNWFVTTAYTRLEPGGNVIILATRWHTDDLIGRIMKEQPGEWTYIELPALALEGDIIGRQVGEALFPERYPVSRLLELRETLGPIFFEALYQQRPVDESRKLASAAWFKKVPALPLHKKFKMCRCWDLAASEEGGDWTVGALQAWNIDDKELYITNIVRGQWSPQTAESKVIELARVDGPDVKVLIEQEPGASGKALVEHYQRLLRGIAPCEPVPTVQNKVVRAQPMLAAAEAGKVFLIEGPWNETYLREIDSFPGEYDDQVDTTSAGYTFLSGRNTFSAVWGRSRKPIEGKGGKSSNSGKEGRRAMFNASTYRDPNVKRGGATW